MWEAEVLSAPLYSCLLFPPPLPLVPGGGKKDSHFLGDSWFGLAFSDHLCRELDSMLCEGAKTIGKTGSS